MDRYLTIEQASRATIVAFEANIPIAWWGPPGIGKSTGIAQIQDMLDDDYVVFDLRLSDKEPSDVGGIPFPGEEVVFDEKGNPVLGEDKKPTMRRVLEFLVMKLLPFDSHQKAIVLLDEFDRADISVQNAALQLVLDRKVNGHKLSPGARIVLAGNAASDVGTSPLSAAAANRMCHLYIDVNSKESMDGWTKWAENNGISPLLQGFANYQTNTFAGGDPKAKKVDDMAIPTPRSFVYVDKLMAAAEAVPFETEDIIPALVAGCVGKQAASSFLGYRDVYSSMPTIAQIVANPEGIPISKNPGVLFAHKKQLVLWAADNEKYADAIARYAIRWEEEPAADMFRMLREVQPKILETAAYKQWEQNRDQVKGTKSGTAASGVIHKAYCMSCKNQVEIANPRLETQPNGKPEIKGTCPVCGTIVITYKTTGEALPTPPAPAPQLASGVLSPKTAQTLAKVLGEEYVGDLQSKNGIYYKNAIKVYSSGGSNKYTVSQNTAGDWACSCRGFTTFRRCKHVVRVTSTIKSGGLI